MHRIYYECERRGQKFIRQYVGMTAMIYSHVSISFVSKICGYDRRNFTVASLFQKDWSQIFKRVREQRLVKLDK
jgi:hypothetical protein